MKKLLHVCRSWQTSLDRKKTIYTALSALVVTSVTVTLLTHPVDAATSREDTNTQLVMARLNNLQTEFELLQDTVIPMYYRSTSLGYSPEWVGMAKQSIASILPRFNMHRMLKDYVGNFYAPAAAQWRNFADDDFKGARNVAEWKSRVREAWHGVKIRLIEQPVARIRHASVMRFEVAVQLCGLVPEDISVELVFTRPGEPINAKAKRFMLKHEQRMETGEDLFVHALTADQCGKVEYRVRVFPTHKLLTHPFEMGMMRWL